MQIPKQLINVIGLVIVLGIVAAGALVVALPIFLQSQSIVAETQTLASTNDAQQKLLDSLAADAQNQSQIEADVAALQRQIPANAQADDVMELVAKAAVSADVVITSVTAAPPESFVAREAATPATAGSQSESNATQDAAGSSASASGQQQAPVTITVSAADVEHGVNFVDALRTGPRLLENVQTDFTPNGAGPVTVTVSALAFSFSKG